MCFSVLFCLEVFLAPRGLCPLHVAVFGTTSGGCGDFDLGFSGGRVRKQRRSKVRAAGVLGRPLTPPPGVCAAPQGTRLPTCEMADGCHCSARAESTGTPHFPWYLPSPTPTPAPVFSTSICLSKPSSILHPPRAYPLTSIHTNGNPEVSEPEFWGA